MEPQPHTSVHFDIPDGSSPKGSKAINWPKCTKIIILTIVWILFTGCLMSAGEEDLSTKLISVPPAKEPKDFIISHIPKSEALRIMLVGTFASDHALINKTTKYLYVSIDLLHSGKAEELVDTWKLTLMDEELFDTSPDVSQSKFFKITSSSELTMDTPIRIRLATDSNQNIAFRFGYDETPVDKDESVIYAAMVLCGLYIMIIWELVNRTFAALLASTMAIGILAALDERPAMKTIMSWIDVEIILLLFGMIILVTILSETGIFDYLAVYAYRFAYGSDWQLVNGLCLFTALMSSFLHNVAIVFLMTPITIRLCEVMDLNPVPILMCTVIYANIGGALTPIGNIANVIIASNGFIVKQGIEFTVFTVHMLIGVILVMIQTYLQLRCIYRNVNNFRFQEAAEIQELRHEIAVWEKAAASLSFYSQDEDLVRDTLVQKINRMKHILDKKIRMGRTGRAAYKQNLEQLQAKYPIRNKSLLCKSGTILVVVIAVYFLRSVPQFHRLSLGWTALLGAILLLIVADRGDMEAVLARVEWSALMFFGGLCVLMEALSELGLIDWIGRMTVDVIMSVDESSRLAVAILIILWVSALASALFDNIPLTTMMIKIAINLAQNHKLNLPLQPLIWALAFGASLGGNGTLIGASANVVCAAVAEQHGYRFTFLEFFKVGFPIMIGSIIVATVYLMTAHVVFEWHPMENYDLHQELFRVRH